jgi:hypothetical protein
MWFLVCKKVQKKTPFTTLSGVPIIWLIHSQEPFVMKLMHRDTRKLLQKTIAISGVVRLEDGAKHAKVRHLVTGDWIPVAGSPSDHRSIKNFEAALRRLATYGQGFVYAKTGHLPTAVI